MGNFTKLFSKIDFKESHLNLGRGPERDWKIIFISIIILALVAISLSVYIFIKIDKGEIFVVRQSEEDKAKSLDISLLKKTVSYYQDKAAKFERMKKERSTVADPSI